MEKTLILSTIAWFCCFLCSCSSVRRVTPLPPGTSALTVSLGGPVTQIKQNLTIPLPLLGVGYSYAINDKLGIEAGVNATSAVFGTLHLDAGVNWFPIKNKGAVPGVTVTPELIVLSRFTFDETRVYPTLTPSVYWNIGKHLLYLGAENWFDLKKIRSDGNEQKRHWLSSPYIGYGLLRKKWQFQVEGRIYTPNFKNTGRITQNTGLGDNGIIGFFVGMSRLIRGDNNGG